MPALWQPKVSYGLGVRLPPLNLPLCPGCSPLKWKRWKALESRGRLSGAQCWCSVGQSNRPDSGLTPARHSTNPRSPGAKCCQQTALTSSRSTAETLGCPAYSSQGTGLAAQECSLKHEACQQRAGGRQLCLIACHQLQEPGRYPDAWGQVWQVSRGNPGEAN